MKRYNTEAFMNKLALPVSYRDHIQGLLTAPITLVEYGDYQCPDCAEAHSIIQKLQQDLSKQLCYVYRHFPRHNLHPDAQHAAEAAEAAANQGKFWEMHNYLYANHQELGNGYLVEYAIALNLDIEKFLSEVTGDLFVQRIQEDLDSGKSSGVITTPTFFVNDLIYSDNLDQDTLLNMLKQAKPNK
jgi:protein-disulfide isomerase